MLQFFAESTLWLKILMILAALPIVCLLLGILVGLGDSSAWAMFEGLRWYQVPLGLMGLGGFVSVVLTLVAGLSFGLQRISEWLFGSGNLAIAFFVALPIVLIGIFLLVEKTAQPLPDENLDTEKRREP